MTNYWLLEIKKVTVHFRLVDISPDVILRQPYLQITKSPVKIDVELNNGDIFWSEIKDDQLQTHRKEWPFGPDDALHLDKKFELVERISESIFDEQLKEKGWS